MQQPDADLLDLGICCKHKYQIMAPVIQGGTGHGCHYRSHHHTGSGAFPHTVDPARTVILSHKGGGRNPKGIDHHPEQAVHLSVGGPCRHIVCSQCVHACLDDNIGDIVHNGLHSRRDSDPHDPPQHPLVDPDLLPLQLVGVLCLHQGPYHQDSAEKL